jgi:hypothetical protein
MRPSRLFKTDNDRAQFGRAQPVRDAASQHAAKFMRLLQYVHGGSLSLAGDNKDKFSAIALRRIEKIPKRTKSRVLMHSVQIENGIDARLALREFCLETSFHTRERRNHWRFCCGRQRLRSYLNPLRLGLYDSRLFRLWGQGIFMPGGDASRHRNPEVDFFVRQSP